MNYETTWYPANHAAYALAKAEKAVGAIRKVVVHAGHRGPKEIGVQPEFLAWLTDPEKNGAGALFDFGCYGANLMTWLMDDARPVSVTAVTQRIKPEIGPGPAQAKASSLAFRSHPQHQPSIHPATALLLPTGLPKRYPS